MKNYLSIGQVAQKLEISNNTIKRWYQWYEDKDTNTDLVLPKYLYFDRKLTKYFNKDDLYLFENFKRAVNKKGSHYGVMSGWRKSQLSKYNKKFKWVSVEDKKPDICDTNNYILYCYESGRIDTIYTDTEKVTHWAIIPIPN